MCRSLYLILSVLASFTLVMGQPKISIIKGTNLDFGDLYQGQKIEKIVSIKNAGTELLKIDNVKASCGCTATLLDKQEIKPNETAILNISFNSQNFSGKVTKTVDISSNDPESPKVTIKFVSNIIQVLKINPPYFGFNNLKVDSVHTREISITNPSKDKTINILSVKSKDENVKVKLMKNTLKPGEETTLQAICQPAKIGSTQGIVELTTDHLLQNKFEIKVYMWTSRK